MFLSISFHGITFSPFTFSFPTVFHSISLVTIWFSLLIPFSTQRKYEESKQKFDFPHKIPLFTLCLWNKILRKALGCSVYRWTSCFFKQLRLWFQDYSIGYSHLDEWFFSCLNISSLSTSCFFPVCWERKQKEELNENKRK